MNGAFSTHAREIIRLRADSRCERCGRRLDYVTAVLSIQHRKARGMGGTDDPGKGDPCNGALLCGSATTGCHGWIEAHPAFALLEGFRVAQSSNPADVPMLLHTRQWVYVDGTISYRLIVGRW